MKFTQSNETEGNSRRGFLKTLAAIPALGIVSSPLGAASAKRIPMDRAAVNAALLSGTTLAGKGSLEHGYEALSETYGTRKNVMLINFASLPDDRDAYAARMQRDFERIDSGFKVSSLHFLAKSDAAKAVRDAEAFFVSGGNTFLLLRELYDREAVDALRERVMSGTPYAGSSAGSNLAGLEIGTTNDFPLVDVKTRRSLGILPACFNPHHPDPRTEKDLFGGRQWKIKNFCRYHKDTTVIGVTNPGVVRLHDGRATLLGEDAAAFIQHGDQEISVYSNDSRDLTAALRL